MESLARLFVGRPITIAAVAAVLLTLHFVWRRSGRGAARRGGPLLVSAVAWGAYAAWEWLVQARTPAADIRVDLLLIWPVLALLTLWSAYRAVRRG